MAGTFRYKIRVSCACSHVCNPCGKGTAREAGIDIDDGNNRAGPEHARQCRPSLSPISITNTDRDAYNWCINESCDHGWQSPLTPPRIYDKYMGPEKGLECREEAVDAGTTDSRPYLAADVVVSEDEDILAGFARSQ